jgi:hypothetical protein
LPADQSHQGRAGAGYDRAGFTIDFDTERARCPQGQTSTWWNPVTQRGTDAIVIKFAAGTCRGCPVREQCTRSTSPTYGRQLTVPPREIHHAQAAARATQNTPDWQARYARRAGVEGTVRQAVAVTGTRRARYRGLPKTRLEHVYSAARAQPHPARRPLQRARTGPHQNQPPHPPRTRTRSLIELASRVEPTNKHLRIGYLFTGGTTAARPRGLTSGCRELNNPCDIYSSVASSVTTFG